MKEVADDVFGGRSEKFVMNLIDDKQLRHIDISSQRAKRRNILIPEDAIDEFFKRRTVNSHDQEGASALKPSRKSIKASPVNGFLAEINNHLKK